ncbi:MAG: hypothetical protein HUJ65_07680 [Oscillospiraceae bacterium]|nr:hypothetical protein [Oscillospiraceae bacterium]
MKKKFLDSKKIPLRLVTIISDIVTAIIVVIILLYNYSKSPVLIVVDIVLFVALILFILFYSRCPYCGKIVARRARQCPECEAHIGK